MSYIRPPAAAAMDKRRLNINPAQQRAPVPITFPPPPPLMSIVTSMAPMLRSVDKDRDQETRRLIRSAPIESYKTTAPPAAKEACRPVLQPPAEEMRRPMGRGQSIAMLGATGSTEPVVGAPIFMSPEALRMSTYGILPDNAPSAPAPMDDHPVPVPPYNWPPRPQSVAANRDLSNSLDMEALRSAVMAQKNHVLMDMNTALTDVVREFRNENGQLRQQHVADQQLIERQNQRLKAATAPEAPMFPPY